MQHQELVTFNIRCRKFKKKHKNNKEKLNQEIMKLYKENNVNPASGCLPLLFQMPILFSLYYVVSQPLKYMTGKSPAAIQQLFEMIPQGSDRITNMHDLSIINYFSKHLDKLSDVKGMLEKDDLLNMNFLGMNLGSVPNLHFNHIDTNNLLILLIPLLAAATTYISTKYSTNQTVSQTSDKQIADSMQGNMNLIASVVTGFMAFTLPAGMGIYWITGNIYQIFQQMFMNKFVIKKSLNNNKKGKKRLRSN